MEYSGIRPIDLPLSREITTLYFPKKFVMLTSNHYSGISDPLLHLRQYQDKMAVPPSNPVQPQKGRLPLVLPPPKEFTLERS